ncbi:hypothetical protein DOTSEDRAFT_39587 [Dothistroma septosporum NZE10]|uniref:Uncharacterized protein n=1 Tax=Dothistroma septosporum (strain NZE10 / CBS 128990) TaxID=675120 RepID=M2YHR1_DOTSN|nr:hypothetical protein DOTSEDRAFT_39587 [Dothistroma septosporum NZE10]
MRSENPAICRLRSRHLRQWHISSTFLLDTPLFDLAKWTHSARIKAVKALQLTKGSEAWAAQCAVSCASTQLTDHKYTQVIGIPSDLRCTTSHHIPTFAKDPQGRCEYNAAVLDLVATKDVGAITQDSQNARN